MPAPNSKHPKSVKDLRMAAIESAFGRRVYYARCEERDGKIYRSPAQGQALQAVTSTADMRVNPYQIREVGTLRFLDIAENSVAVLIDETLADAVGLIR